jgi:hypothetical protein
VGSEQQPHQKMQSIQWKIFDAFDCSTVSLVDLKLGDKKEGKKWYFLT